MKFQREPATPKILPGSVDECATFLAKLEGGRSKRLTSDDIARFARWIAQTHEELTNGCASKPSTLGSVPVRAAGVFLSKAGYDEDRDHAKRSYRALVREDLASMPPAVQALHRRYSGGEMHGDTVYDVFCRAMRAFTSWTAECTDLEISNKRSRIRFVRSLLGRARHEDVLGPASARDDARGA